MKALSWYLLGIGVLFLAIYGYFSAQSNLHQLQLNTELNSERTRDGEEIPDTPAPILSEGEMLGRLEIPRLQLAVMTMEGTTEKTLRLGGGHIPGTAFPGGPGNSGFAAHRDTFFRKLADIKKDDLIEFTTRTHTLSYRVASTAVV